MNFAEFIKKLIYSNNVLQNFELIINSFPVVSIKMIKCNKEYIDFYLGTILLLSVLYWGHVNDLNRDDDYNDD